MDYGELRRDRLDLLKLEDQKEGHRSVYTLASTSRKPKMPTPSDCIHDLETQHGLTFRRRGEKLTLCCPLPVGARYSNAVPQTNLRWRAAAAFRLESVIADSRYWQLSNS